MNNFSRATSAFVLPASLLVSSVAAVAQQAPATKPAEDPQKTSQTPPPAQKQTTPAATTAKSTKPLSTNEDPNMIGKRNINTGIIAKMSGSTEKEVRLGRELGDSSHERAHVVFDGGQMIRNVLVRRGHEQYSLVAFAWGTENRERVMRSDPTEPHPP